MMFSEKFIKTLLQHGKMKCKYQIS